MRKKMLTETIRTYATSLKDSLLQLRQSGPKKGVEITYIYYCQISYFFRGPPNLRVAINTQEKKGEAPRSHWLRHRLTLKYPTARCPFSKVLLFLGVT